MPGPAAHSWSPARRSRSLIKSARMPGQDLGGRLMGYATAMWLGLVLAQHDHRGARGCRRAHLSAQGRWRLVLADPRRRGERAWRRGERVAFLVSVAG